MDLLDRAILDGKNDNTMTLNKNKRRDIKLGNVLNVRFLSLLNPCRELYEEYFIYYRDPTIGDGDSYVKVRGENILVNQLHF